MLMRTFGTLALALILSIAAFAQPKLKLEGEGKALDFGDVTAGMKITHVVNLSNVGKDTLKISNVRAQCGCTATLLKENVLAPGASTQMTVTFDSRNYPTGKVVKHVYITSNDSSVAPNGTATLEFMATVAVPLAVEPAFFNFNQAKVDSDYSKTLLIKNTSKRAITIDSLSFKSNILKLHLGKKRLEPGESTELEGTLHPVEPGSFQGVIDMYTNHPDQPKVEIRYLSWINRK